ncbi:MAG: hypothetical protein R3B13_18795 [Polyangiaceae bacterium]
MRGAEARERREGLRALHHRLSRAASDGVDGALAAIVLADHGCGEFRALGNEGVDSVLEDVRRIAHHEARGASWIRASWARHEALLLGPRAHVVASANAVACALASNPATRRFAWLVVLTRIYPGNPERTLHCDPNYDLKRLDATCVVWVEPYPGDDWQRSQRYPSVEVLQTYERI